jgi:tRNA guanosine-2'-O-methyltransferase
MQVKQKDLIRYLQAKKKQGYTLVGVEQTANSVSLLDYQFAPNSVLLLGAEQQGIPVEFLQHLDQCVEIPQLGVIRSLNVHVSASIMVWEYTRQQLLRAAQPVAVQEVDQLESQAPCDQ